MDWSQVAYISALTAALLWGKPSRLVILVMTGNLVATVAQADSYTAVGVTDLVSCAIFLSHRDYALALLFAVMVPVYVVGDAFALSHTAVYGVVDFLAYIQLVVVSVGGGGGGIRKRFGPRRHDTGRDIFSRGRDHGYPQVGRNVPVDQAEYLPKT